MEDKKVMAMYDVRGIQNYIYRTSKIKDAIGASAIVEDIIFKALEASIQKMRSLGINGTSELTSELEWVDETQKRALKYTGTDKDIQVLYIGGGNAFVIYKNNNICEKINELMSLYIIENTYSLQLATAYVNITDSYKSDYKLLIKKMNDVKRDMRVSKPLGALPVMSVDKKTGFPISGFVNDRGMLVSESRETALKREKEEEIRRKNKNNEKIFDNYITEKGKDSTIAVVHIDGNNMGLRIRSLTENENTYEAAVTKMRQISYNINSAYKNVFEEIRKEYESVAENGKHFVMKVIVAGDDITYICNGQIALDTVKKFCQKISHYTMWKEGEKASDKEIEKYGFSVCAGVAYIGSHFPFSVGYDVAEQCCESAKNVAKSQKYCINDRIGNWVDFHICQNVYARDFDAMREKEYVSPSGENLLMRPYCIETEAAFDAELNSLVRKEKRDYTSFEKTIRAFNSNSKESLPRSFAKALRNTYSFGKAEMGNLVSFLNSRNWKLPNNVEMKIDNMYEGNKARWYDALEVMDLFGSEEVCDDGTENAEN